MRRHYLIASLLCTALALAVAPARAEIPPLPIPKPAMADSAAPEASTTTLATETAPTETPAADTAHALVPAHPVVEIIRAKLADTELRKDANADDLTALEAFYGKRADGPLWMTEMGFTAKGQAALFEIDKADDWGLDKAAFVLPQAHTLPASPEDQAVAEIKLDLAILKYARFARGGRFKPEEISELFDQEPLTLDPHAVLTEIAASDAPGAYLQSLHPKHEPFARLRQALIEARGKDAEDAKAEVHATDIKRIVLNMERWRWLPEDLGEIYVWLNTPNFMLYFLKDGKTIFTDKTLVGTIGNPTPVFSADMATVVFNPEWIAPRSVLREALLPPLRKKNYDFLKKHRFSVSYGGKPVNAAKVKWTSANIHNYTFIQKPGPGNNLGKIKFLYPNKHDVYMHDTLPVRKKVFQKSARAIGYGCVRMEKPDKFAELLLAEDQALPASKVKELWDKSVNKPVAVGGKIPVHTTYFTALVDEKGKVATYADLYGLDRKMAAAMFGSADGFPLPPPEVKQRRATGASASQTTSGSSGMASALQGSLGD
ncbi:MAG: L,D-transpeptidase family protein [Methyloceanibacter sp.]